MSDLMRQKIESVSEIYTVCPRAAMIYLAVIVDRLAYAVTLAANACR